MWFSLFHFFVNNFTFYKFAQFIVNYAVHIVQEDEEARRRELERKLESEKQKPKKKKRKLMWLKQYMINLQNFKSYMNVL